MRGWARHRIVRHGGFWAATLAANLLVQLPAHLIVGTPLQGWRQVFVQLPASVLTIYPLLYGVLPRLLRPARRGAGWAGLVAWLLFSVLTANAMRALYAFGSGLTQRGSLGVGLPRWPGPWELDYTWFVLVATAGAASAIKVLNGWYAERQREQAERQRRLAVELQLLKAQLQPVFLFNTLATLRTLTRAKSAAAPGAVLHLAELLRYLLYDGPREAVPLADELAMLRHYVALEQLRLGPRVEVSLSFSGALAAHRIAPLLLLPALENAFRHGTAPGPDHAWISVDLVARPNLLTFKVLNGQPAAPPAVGLTPPAGSLTRLRQRLARLYPGRHELKITAEADTFLLALRLRNG